MSDQTERIALFIDGGYLTNAANAIGLDVDFKRLLDMFEVRGKLLRANYYAVYEDEVFSPLRPLLDWLAYNGYSVVERDVRSHVEAHGVKKKWPRIEIDIVVDAMQLSTKIDHMVLFSANGAFRHLVAAVQRRGVHVTVVATLRAPSLNIADELRRQSDTFVDLADWRAALERQAIARPNASKASGKGSKIPSTKGR